MSSARSWNVRPSRFPFGVSVEIVGVVSGETREDAQRKACDLYGRDVVVELAHSGPNSSEYSRVNRSGNGAIPLPRRELERAVLRDMTADEAQMARAASCCPMLSTSAHKSRIRMLHARTLTANRTISDADARLLRAVVLACKAALPAEIVAMAEARP